MKIEKRLPVTLEKRFNLSYIIINIFYYASNAAFGAFGTLFMVSRELDETTIGLVFSSASVLSLLMQKAISQLFDKKSGMTGRKMLFSVCLFTVGLIFFLIFVRNQWMTAIFLALGWAAILSIMPLLSSLAVEYRTKGYRVNFSLTRAFGSTFYAVTSILLGRFFVTHSSEWLPVFTLLMVGGLILSGLFLPERKIGQKDKGVISQKDKDVSFQEDARAVKNFKWVLLGLALLMIMHNITTSFMLQILGQVGGNEADVGLAVGLSSMAEIPILIFYNPLAKRIGHRKLLLISAWGFTFKALMILFAADIPAVYLAQSLQITAYGLYVSAILEYTNCIMKPLQAIKTQFDVSIFLTMGGIIGNIAGGWLLDELDVQAMLVFGAVTTILGLLCFVKGLRKSQADSVKGQGKEASVS